MCGICGIATPHDEAPTSADTLRRMADALAHRGPDAQGSLIRPGVALASRRLAIIDPHGPDQPILNETGDVALVANAEIYNAPELRTQLQDRGHRFATGSDVEVILHLYEDHGPDCLHHLRGMFALALWDGPGHSLLLARDRLGIKPLCYALAPDRSLTFASEVKSILMSGALAERTLDVRALADTFALGGPLFDRTLVRGIHQLEPGHSLTYRHGRIETRRYWDLTFDRDTRRTDAQWSEDLRDTLRETVRIHMRSDVGIGCWLSPGLDSSSVAALAALESDDPLRCFSIGFDEPRCDELSRRRTLDRLTDLPITRTTVRYPNPPGLRVAHAVWAQEQPARLQLSIFALAEATAPHFKTVLTGQGADEILAGYPWYRRDKLLAPLSRLPRSLRNALAAPIRRGDYRNALLLDHPISVARFVGLIGTRRLRAFRACLTPDLRAAFDRTLDDGHAFTPPDDFHRWARLEQLTYIESKTRLDAYINHALDLNAMAHSLEARLPFLDHHLVELCARMPPRLKLRRLREKHALRRAMRPHLPRQITHRRKRGLLSPSPDVLTGETRELAEDLLSPHALRDKGYFDPRAVQALRHAEDHPDERTRRSTLASVFGLQLWDELFIRGCRPGWTPPAFLPATRAATTIEARPSTQRVALP